MTRHDTPLTDADQQMPIALYPSLDRKRIIRDADAGRVRRINGVDVHNRAARRTAHPGVRINATEMEAAGWLELRPDGYWRPTPLGASIAGIASEATR